MANNTNQQQDDGSRPAGDGGQTIEQARENGRRGAEKARQMREAGQLPPDNGAGTMKGVPGGQPKS